MKTRIVYLVLCVLGTILPCWQLIAWLFERGPDPRRFLQDLFANRISTFFVLDVVISAAVLIVFIQAERLRARIRRSWIPILATFLGRRLAWFADVPVHARVAFGWRSAKAPRIASALTLIRKVLTRLLQSLHDQDALKRNPRLFNPGACFSHLKPNYGNDFGDTIFAEAARCSDARCVVTSDATVAFGIWSALA